MKKHRQLYPLGPQLEGTLWEVYRKEFTDDLWMHFRRNLECFEDDAIGEHIKEHIWDLYEET